MNKTNKETILIKNIEQLKQTIKNKSYNNYELVEPIMIKGVKCSKPEPKAPEWFSSWVKNQYEKTPPSWFTGWVKNQYEKDIKHINNRIDKVDTRLDNVEHILERHDQILKRHDQILERHDQILKCNKLK